MGLFNFVKEAGERILHTQRPAENTTEAPQAEAAPVESAPVDSSASTATYEPIPDLLPDAASPTEDSASAPTEESAHVEESSAEAESSSTEESEAQSIAAEQLVQAVNDLGISIENLGIVVEGDRATITGTAATQEDREKAILAVGNTSGIAQVDDQMEVTEPAPEAVFYTVVEGDTLWGIAAAQYGDGSQYMLIFEANRPMLENPDLIYPGQSLRIPQQ